MQSLLPESSSLPHRNSTVKPRLLPLHFAIAKVRVRTPFNRIKFLPLSIAAADRLTAGRGIHGRGSAIEESESEFTFSLAGPWRLVFCTGKGVT
jgi:hypothetical protein